MASHFVIVASAALGGDTLYAVSEPKKKDNGKWGVSKTSTLIPNNTPGGTYNSTFRTFTSLGSIVRPVVDKKPKSKNDIVNKYRQNSSYITMIKDLSEDDFIALINSYNGTKHKSMYDIKASNLKSFMKSFDAMDVNYLDNVAKDLTGDFGVLKHTKGNWKITRNSTNKLVDTWGWGRGKTTTDTASITNSSKDKDMERLLVGMLVLTPPYGCENNVTNKYTITLTFTSEKLALKNNWELGAIAGTGNEWGDNYCFYCSDVGMTDRVSHFCSSLPCYLKSNASKIHKKSTHVGSSSSTGTDVVISTGTDVSTYESITYDPSKIYHSKTWSTIGTAVKHLEYGTKGTYMDGVATLPYVIIELRGDDSKTSPAFNMSIPANTFISLSHERNLGDGYNTFSLQLFDKDALVVEDKLLLGFRYITFYYTDFVSTSKRFKGEVLDFKTVIAGKGLMLTLTGYSSSSTIYTGKESIPWSTLCAAKDWSFYYWLNEAGEYHGPVYYTEGTYYTGNTSGDAKQGPIYNSTEGIIVGPTWLEHAGKTSKNALKNVEYCLKAPMEIIKEGDEEPTQSTEFCTFDYYYRGSDSETLERYKPHPEKWSLESYNSNIANELAAWSLGDIMEMRPHNIVILICVINKWLWDPKYITKTRKVSEIPDMVSKSFVEYIKESLIPISIATGKNGSSQFYFWFDDNGYAHFGPKDDLNEPKSLYFNAKEVDDSYPLIAFTAASNGSAIMQTDGSQSISSVNIFTGDELDVSSVSLEDGDEYLDSVHQSAEWYVTNTKTQSSKSKYYSASYSGTSVIASEDDLKKQLAYRYGIVSKFSYTASLDVYGCSDIEPGQMINVYIYVGDGKRTKDAVSKEDENSTTGYIGNVTMHHSSGTYFVNKIKDTISGGKYISTLEVLKVDYASIESIMGSDDNETMEIETSSGTESSGDGECVNFNSYTAFKSLNK